MEFSSDLLGAAIITNLTNNQNYHTHGLTYLGTYQSDMSTYDVSLLCPTRMYQSVILISVSFHIKFMSLVK